MQLICMSARYTNASFHVAGVKHDEPAAFNISSGYIRTKWTFLICAGVHGGVLMRTSAVACEDANTLLHLTRRAQAGFQEWMRLISPD